MTIIVFTVDGVDYSNFVLQADIWRENLFTIGRWEVVLDPRANNWLGTFNSDNDVSIWIDGSQMMNGYVDDVKPFLDRRGVFTDLYGLIGRDYAFDLANFYLSVKYPQPGPPVIERADDIVDDALALAQALGSELIYASPSAAPNVNYEFDRTFLSDGIAEIAQDVGFDGYVQNTKVIGLALLHFFQAGSVAYHQTVDLISIANDQTNNILLWNMGEKLGFDIRNRIEVVSGNLSDHYTNLNASDWNAIAGVVSDETTIWLNGRAAIRATQNVVGLQPIEIELDFTGAPPGLYGYETLDLSEPARGRYNYLAYEPLWIIKRCNIGLEDVNGDEISYYRVKPLGVFECFNCTNQSRGWNPAKPNVFPWRSVDFTVGEDSAIENVLRANDSKGHWYFRGGSTTFDWTQVQKIKFGTVGVLQNQGSWFIVDGLSLGNHEAIALAEDAGPGSSQAEHGLRMLPVFRPDIKSQLELQAFADWTLTLQKNPMETINILASGQVNSVYAAQSLDVRIGNYIPALTKYRILELHHSVVKTSQESDVPGYDFTTEYDLIKHTVGGLTQQINPITYSFQKSPVKGRLLRDRANLRYVERTQDLE